MTRTKDVYQIIHEEHDDTQHGKKVVSVGGEGRTVAYEDSNFVSGDSPATHDVNTDLGRNSRSGSIMNDGSGKILVEISDNGTTYGGQHTLYAGESLNLEGLDVDKIKITHSADSAYRILVV